MPADLSGGPRSKILKALERKGTLEPEGTLEREGTIFPPVVGPPVVFTISRRLVTRCAL
jgi:hypothetical protein